MTYKYKTSIYIVWVKLKSRSWSPLLTQTRSHVYILLLVKGMTGERGQSDCGWRQNLLRSRTTNQIGPVRRKGRGLVSKGACHRPFLRNRLRCHPLTGTPCCCASRLSWLRGCCLGDCCHFAWSSFCLLLTP